MTSLHQKIYPKIIPVKLPNKPKKKGTIFSPSPDDQSTQQGGYIAEKSYSNHNIFYGPTSSCSLFDRWMFDREKISTSYGLGIYVCRIGMK